LNNEGNYFATCSNKGTMIRIYQTKNGKFIKEFRRGLEKNKINWLSFSKNSDIIICQSPNTIHLFYTYFKNILKKNNTIYNIFGYLTNNYFKNSFIKFQFPNIKTISTIYNSNILIVISYHGFYYEINFKNHEFVNVLKKKLI
jgi:WD40 repeat protein